MSKTFSNDLHELIHSMNKSEKRYFSLYSSRYTNQKNKNYLELFNHIGRQKSLDDYLDLKDTKETKKISRDKKYLRNSILKSLNSYHSDSFSTVSIRNMLNTLEILYRKGLFDFSLILCEKTQKLAEKYDSIVLMSDILNRKVLILSTLKPKNWQVKIKEVFELEEKYYEKIKLFHEYRHAYLQVNTLLNTTGELRSTLEKDKMLSKYQKIQPPAPYYKESFEINYYYLSFKSNLDLLIGADRKALESRQALLLLFEKHPHQIKDKTWSYISALLNNVATLCKVNLYEKALSTTEKIHQVKTRFHFESMVCEISYHIQKFALLIDMGKFKNAYEFSPLVEETIKKYHDKLTEEMHIVSQFNFIHMHFSLCNHNKALMACNKLLGDKPNIRQDLYVATKIIKLLISLDRNDLVLIDYSIRNTYNYLSKKNQLYDFEKLMLSGIKKICQTINPSDRTPHYVQLKKAILELISKGLYGHELMEFDFISWLDSKIEDRPFAEIVREKFQKNKKYFNWQKIIPI